MKTEMCRKVASKMSLELPRQGSNHIYPKKQPISTGYDHHRPDRSEIRSGRVSFFVKKKSIKHSEVIRSG